MLEYIPIIIPSLLGYGTSLICKVQKDSGSKVNFRPPPVVFSIVWPILYILFGLSWYYSRQKDQIYTDIFYSILTVLLTSWIVVYSCNNNKKLGVYILALAFTVSIACYTIAVDKKSKLMIVPLIGWLLFATLLNIFEIQQ